MQKRVFTFKTYGNCSVPCHTYQLSWTRIPKSKFKYNTFFLNLSKSYFKKKKKKGTIQISLWMWKPLKIEISSILESLPDF